MKHSYRDSITIDAIKNVSTYKAIIAIIITSAVAFVFLIWLLYFKQPPEQTFGWVRRLPAVNTTLNSISALLLLTGYLQIRKKKIDLHMRYMIGAFLTSTLFLVSYVVYHNFVGHTPFPGTGFIRPIYFFILITHIILSAGVVPLILSSFYFAFAGNFQMHRRISMYTFPIWMYVSVTGVMIFFILNAYL